MNSLNYEIAWKTKNTIDNYLYFRVIINTSLLEATNLQTKLQYQSKISHLKRMRDSIMRDLKR